MLITWLNDLQRNKLGVKHYFFNDYKETLEKFNLKFPNVETKDSVFNLDRLSTYIKNNINTNLITANIIFEISSLSTK